MSNAAQNSPEWWWRQFRQLVIDTRHDEKSSRTLLAIIDDAIAKCVDDAVDRSWWKQTYAAGIEASLTKRLRTPPDHLTEDQRDVWLAGYDR